MPTEFPFSPSPKPRRKNFWPGVVLVGAIFGAGAWFWAHDLTPSSAAAPEIRTAQAQAPAPEDSEAPEPDWKIAPDTEKKAAEKIIVAQLEAFKADDYKEAEKYQASGLKDSFASTEQFRQVIKQNYPQFANYKAVKWGNARIAGPLLQIQIVITGQDDAQLVALYSMIKENVGAKGEEKLEYRVSGVGGGSEEIAPSQIV